MKEGEKRISIAASNELQEPEILNLEFEMVGKVSGVKIDDFQKITRKEELKHFEITFDLLGAYSCMVIDFKDGVVRSYGYEPFCREWKPDVKFDPTITSLKSPLPLTYTY